MQVGTYVCTSCQVHTYVHGQMQVGRLVRCARGKPQLAYQETDTVHTIPYHTILYIYIYLPGQHTYIHTHGTSTKAPQPTDPMRAINTRYTITSDQCTTEDCVSNSEKKSKSSQQIDVPGEEKMWFPTNDIAENRFRIQDPEIAGRITIDRKKPLASYPPRFPPQSYNSV